MTAVPFLVFGAFVLLMLGFLAVLVFQSYPVVGMTVMALGMTVCSFGMAGILLSFAFHRRQMTVAAERISVAEAETGTIEREAASETQTVVSAEKASAVEIHTKDAGSKAAEDISSVREV